MNQFFRFKKFIEYQWHARTKYYLHSPFVYQFYLNVLEQQPDEDHSSIRLLRKQLNSDKTSLPINDLGTGKMPARTISEIENKVAIRDKYGALLYRMARYFEPKTIIELGTSIGLSSAYLAKGNPQARIITLEGEQNLVDCAKQNYLKLNVNNIETVSGNFEQRLPAVLGNLSSLDMVFFDGNHKKSATLNYFHQCLEHVNENSIFIFDDIHYSEEMNEAWQQIKQSQRVKLSIDVFQLGICFFMKEKLAKEDFVLRY